MDQLHELQGQHQGQLLSVQSNASEASQLLQKQLEDQNSQINATSEKLAAKKVKMREFKANEA